MLDARIIEKLEGLSGADFKEVLNWARGEIKSEIPLEETVAKLHLFSLAEIQTRPSFLALDAKPPEFYERRRILAKETLIFENLEYQEFLRSLEGLAQGKFDGAEKKKIAGVVSFWYTELLIHSDSIPGTYAAATPRFRSHYLKQLVQNKISPGHNFFNLMGVLAATEDMRLVSALLETSNLLTLLLLDEETKWIKERYSSSVNASRGELEMYNARRKRKIGPEMQPYHEAELGRIEQNIIGFAACRERHDAASRQLVSVLFDSNDKSVWRDFLLYKDNFGVVTTNSGIHSPGLGAIGKIDYDPETKVADIKRLVERSVEVHPRTAFNFLGRYLDIAWKIPEKYRYATEQLVHTGQWELPRLLCLFAANVQRERRAYEEGSIISNEEQLLEQLYDQIVSGNFTPNGARTIPRKFYSLRQQLTELVDEKNHLLPVQSVQERFGYALVSKELLSDPDLAVGIASLNLDLTSEYVSDLLKPGYSREQIIHRLQYIRKWSEQTRATLTQRLIGHLVAASDLESACAGLEGLLARTASGNFDINNIIQKELEFGKYFIKNGKKHDREPKIEQLYSEFQNLEAFGSSQDDEVSLNLTEIGAVERAAYEAALFSRFVQGLRDTSSRNVYVIGNIRYGQLFVVQPLEDFLDPNTRLAYYRVSSSETKESSIPDVFPLAFVREMAATMPHLVIVDNAAASNNRSTSRFSRATLGYANWFATFNELRAAGILAKYKKDSSLTDKHLHVLRNSLNFADTIRRLEQLIGEGSTYRVAQWMPYLENEVVYGEIAAERQPFENKDDKPLVIFANPIVYGDWQEGVSHALKGTTPNFWDDPEKYAGTRELIGFGPHGLESRTDGRDKDKLVELVQQKITLAIPKYMRRLEVTNT